VLEGSLFCVWHDADARPREWDVRGELERAVAQPEHWLEGAILSDQKALRQLNLFGAKLPFADFEGVDLSDTVLAEACLDGAVFRGAIVTRVILNSSSLVRAVFAGAIADDVQLENADLSDANLEGIRLDGARLMGLRLSQHSTVYGAAWGTIKELREADFRKAVFVLRQLSLQLRQIDNDQADRFYFLEMTARHLWATRSRVLPDGSWYRRLTCWFAPGGRGLRMVPVCFLWALHRWIWGYAIRPLRTLVWMVCVMLCFTAVFHRVGIAGLSQPTVWDDLALSVVTFATLGYGNRTPYGAHGELLGGCEALCGMLLSSMFLVALVNRYAQRG
jgi:hypothetical protein